MLKDLLACSQITTSRCFASFVCFSLAELTQVGISPTPMSMSFKPTEAGQTSSAGTCLDSLPWYAFDLFAFGTLVELIAFDFNLCQDSRAQQKELVHRHTALQEILTRKFVFFDKLQTFRPMCNSRMLH